MVVPLYTISITANDHEVALTTSLCLIVFLVDATLTAQLFCRLVCGWTSLLNRQRRGHGPRWHGLDPAAFTKDWHMTHAIGQGHSNSFLSNYTASYNTSYESKQHRATLPQETISTLR